MATSEFVVANPWRSDQRGPVRWIWSHVSRNRFVIFSVLAGAFGNAALAAFIPYYTGVAFDAVLAERPDRSLLFWACVWVVVSQVARSLLQWGRNFASEVLGQRLERDARDELYGALLGKSMSFHDSHASGEMMARATNDVHELALMFTPGLNLVVGSFMFLLMPLLLSAEYHPALLATPALFLIAYMWLLRRYLGQLNVRTAQVRQSFGEMNSALTQAIEGIETVKGGAQEAREVSRFERFTRNVRDAMVRQGDLEARFLPLLLLGLAQALSLWHSIVLFRQGALSVGDVVAYQGIIALYIFPVNVSLLAYSQVSSGITSARRILALMEEEQGVDHNPGGYDQPMRGHIRFENVTFRYKSAGLDGRVAEDDTLKDVSFEVLPGETLAVVGQTGSGKSTIGKLLNRTYDVDAGRILVDGVDVRDWNLAALRRQISIIEQDIFLFSRTIRENIAFGQPGASATEIERAAGAAQASDFIATFPLGYESEIGERGVMLSGGQRQRLALARAFLTEPAILLLDDSTSAIDSATEDRIQRAIETAAEGRTTILITHRLSQIRHADRIVVLRKGRLIARGTHEELLARSEAYRNIFAR